LDGIASTGDRRREADAVLTVTYVVVHRLRNGHDVDAEFVELGGIAERVVTADYDQMFDRERREVANTCLERSQVCSPFVFRETGKFSAAR
jgi:hypothetical protein